MKGREEDEVTAGKMADERTDIRIGDEKIEGEGEGTGEWRGRKEEHTDEAEVCVRLLNMLIQSFY